MANQSVNFFALFQIKQKWHIKHLELELQYTKPIVKLLTNDTLQ